MIDKQAVLTSVHLTLLSSSRIDKTITQRVLNNAGASGNAGHWKTALFPNGALDPVSKFDGTIGAYNRKMTLPWSDKGTRILPQAKFMEYTDQMSELSERRAQLVDEFMDKYDDFVDEVRRSSQGIFRDDFYLPKEVARTKFSMKCDIQPIPGIQDFRVDASKKEVAEMEKALAEKLGRAVESAETDLAERIALPLAKLVEKLSEKPKDGKKDVIFHDTLFSNISEIVREIPAFNITGNPAFEELHRKMSAPGAIANLNAEIVRGNPAMKEVATKQATIFLDQLNEVFG